MSSPGRFLKNAPGPGGYEMTSGVNSFRGGKIGSQKRFQVKPQEKDKEMSPGPGGYEISRDPKNKPVSFPTSTLKYDDKMR